MGSSREVRVNRYDRSIPDNANVSRIRYAFLRHLDQRLEDPQNQMYFQTSWSALDILEPPPNTHTLIIMIERLANVLNNDSLRQAFTARGHMDFLAGPRGLPLWCRLMEKHLPSLKSPLLERALYALKTIDACGVAIGKEFTEAFMGRIRTAKTEMTRENAERWSADLRSGLNL